MSCNGASGMKCLFSKFKQSAKWNMLANANLRNIVCILIDYWKQLKGLFSCKSLFLFCMFVCNPIDRNDKR